MELYIGGYAQGKKDYVLQKYPDSILWDVKDMDLLGDICEKKSQHIIINGFHLWVRKFLQQGIDKEEILQKLHQLEDAGYVLCIISDEIGNGIVPMEAKERNWREETGRVLCMIAKEAQRVERIICGIPQILK